MEHFRMLNAEKIMNKCGLAVGTLAQSVLIVSRLEVIQLDSRSYILPATDTSFVIL